MFKRELGRTGEMIAAIGQGMTRTGASSSPEADANRIRVLRRGIELGMNLVDTAELYGGGHGEEVAGRAIAGNRDEVFLTGKFNPNNADRDHLMEAAERSLKRLGTDRFDLYQVHWPNISVPHEETLRAMADLVSQGKVRHIGLSNYTKDQLVEARASVPDIQISAVQSEYNLYQRQVEKELLPYCADVGMTLLAYSPLDGGSDSSGDPRMVRFREIADHYGASPQQLILRWLLSHERTVVLVKTATDAHLQSNALAADMALSEVDKQAIDTLFEQRVFEIDPDDICVSRADGYAHETVDAARRNDADLIPSPQVVADNFSSGHMLQPVGLREVPDGKGGRSYALADNERLYWGWRLANEDGAPIPVYVKHVAASQ
jgi:diketogulonate reductase-like aldo/keto reductase